MKKKTSKKGEKMIKQTPPPLPPRPQTKKTNKNKN